MRIARLTTCCVLLAACGHGDPASTDLGPTETASGPGALAAPLSDGQSSQAVASFGKGELATAQAAHLANADAASFAMHLVDVYKQADADLMALDDSEHLDSSPSPLSSAIDQTMTAAQAAGAGGDAAFLSTQVALHQQMLVLIDCVLMPQMGDITLASFVVGPLRSHVSLDLQTALSLSGVVPSPTDGGVLDCSAMCSTTLMLDDALRTAVCAP